MMPPGNSATHWLVGELWPPEALVSEAAFNAATGKVVASAFHFRNQEDFNNAELLHKALLNARQVWPAEPQASILDNAALMTACLLADWHICAQRYGTALDLADFAWQALAARTARRLANGLPPCPGSETRWNTIGILADAKWRMDAPDKVDFLLTPTQQVQGWLDLESRLQALLRKYASDPVRAERFLHGYLWSGLWVLCCATRFGVEQRTAALELFNHWQLRACDGPGLSPQVKHWQSHAADERPSLWYWHFEIAKLWLNANSVCPLQPGPGVDGLVCAFDELYTNLSRAASSSRWAVENGPYLRSIAQDQRWMRNHFRTKASGLTLLPAR